MATSADHNIDHIDAPLPDSRDYLRNVEYWNFFTDESVAFG